MRVGCPLLEPSSPLFVSPLCIHVGQHRQCWCCLATRCGMQVLREIEERRTFLSELEAQGALKRDMQIQVIAALFGRGHCVCERGEASVQCHQCADA